MIKLINSVASSLLILSLFGCSGKVKDDDQTPLIIHGYADHAFSIRIFELKTDSTFKFWRDVHLEKFIVDGFWSHQNDTFYLIDLTKKKRYGKIYIKSKEPKFEIESNDSTLIDLENPNIHLTLHNPPININFEVRR